ncbi:hypothetical protein QWY31_07440 [Cytophagales bacterium LB-30]|uniref:Uncharacterized protein n=1 Tax=Shiella aurantiaca TaxID=3058365 RepID=A0ABT8F4Y5_9BACT|nr:hypothetical protein [Shiella aurantiaca]MDN4165329.1 hypothetical protein [Shiella aurantiaca]
MEVSPEQYLKLEEELHEAREEIDRLKLNYKESLACLKEEINYLKEQLLAQRNMLGDTLDYALRLQKELGEIKKEITTRAIR